MKQMELPTGPADAVERIISGRNAEHKAATVLDQAHALMLQGKFNEAINTMLERADVLWQILQQDGAASPQEKSDARAELLSLYKQLISHGTDTHYPLDVGDINELRRKREALK